MRTWIFLALVVVGLLAFGAIVWFAGPLIGFGGVVPLEAEWLRLSIILIVWLSVGLIYLLIFLRRRRAAKKLEQGLIASQEETGDGKLLSERMAEALQTLKAASGRSNYLYVLPWYIIIGPPAAGKTTALLKSGLKFPLAGADGGASIAGTGGTRYCDWWFTEDAVLIDTAGRYTTQDSDTEADKKSWLGFLSLLKRNRPKQPINGVIVAISLQDIMTLDKSELAAHATAIRKRLIEVNQQLRIDFPVYMLFTKADLISGFNEYFGNFTESRRRKVWGATFQTEDRRKNMIGAVPAEFDALIKRLTEELPDRLQEEPDATSRIAIFGFPAQVAMLKDRVYDFLGQIFEPNRYQVNANLRGFYFSSGTQEGTPIDQVLGAMDRSFGAGQGFRQLSGLGKSYFLHDLITKVIFSETGWVSLDMGAMRRSALVRYGTMAILGVVSLLLLGGWGWSYFNNDALIDSTNQFIANYRVEADEHLNATTVADVDLLRVLPELEMLRNMPVGVQRKGEPVPLGETFGLSQRDRLVTTAETTYRQALERLLRSRLILRLERQLEQTIADPMATYETLKAYMMLGGQAPSDDPYLIDWMTQDWETNLAGETANRQTREALLVHLRAMLELDDGQAPTFDLNPNLVRSAQETLTRLTIADQAYAVLQSLPPREPLEDFNVAARAGAESDKVFETVDGSDFTALTIPALYTYRGFHEHFLGELSLIAETLKEELWVRGELGRELLDEDEFGRLGPQLLQLYSRDFVAAWTGVLENIKLKTLPGERPDYVTLSVASNLASSPIKALVAAIATETRLTQEPPEAAGAAGTEVEALGTVANLALERLQQRAGRLQRIGINYALQKADGRPGDAPNVPAQVPGASVEAQFADYAVLLEGEPAPIDTLLADLNDIYRNLVVAARDPSQAAQAAGATQLRVANLSVNASRLPAALSRIVGAAVSDLEGDAAGTSRAQLNQALASTVTRVCEQMTENFYPFAEESSRDLPMDNFAQLFAPGGVLDTFYAENLSKLADESTDPWSWNSESALGRELSKTALRQFQRAREIRDAFFPGNTALPSVTLTITQLSLNAAAQIALLDINGEVIQTQQVGNLPKTIKRPGERGGGAVTISLAPEMPGRSSTATVPGPWALMRVIRHNTLSRQGDVLRVQIIIDGRDVNYSFQVGTIFNPFFLPALEEFSCPTSL